MQGFGTQLQDEGPHGFTAATVRYLNREGEGDLYVINLIDRDSVKCVALLGVPVEVGASQPGTLMGPAALRTAGAARDHELDLITPAECRWLSENSH
jgi:hypothetical protein